MCQCIVEHFARVVFICEQLGVYRQMPYYRTSGGKYVYSAYPPIEGTIANAGTDIGIVIGLCVAMLLMCGIVVTLVYWLDGIERRQRTDADVREYV